MPEAYRGSMYSLISSLTSITGALILFIGSKYLIKYSLSQSFYYLGLIGILGSVIVFFSLIRYNIKTTIKEPMGFLTAFLVKSKTGLSSFFMVNRNENLGVYNATINNTAPSNSGNNITYDTSLPVAHVQIADG